jgi:hypothetical protein
MRRVEMDAQSGDEVLPAGGPQRSRASVRGTKREEGFAGIARQQGSDPGNRDPSDSARNSSTWICGEEKFVVFATVQGSVHGLLGIQPAGQGMERKSAGVNFGADPGRFAQMSEIRGEAVAQIDGCRGKPVV